jgi:hypothetical protein
MGYCKTSNIPSILKKLIPHLEDGDFFGFSHKEVSISEVIVW